MTSGLSILAWDRDDDMLEDTRRDGFRRVRVYRPDGVAVVMGRGGKLDEEVHAEALRADGVPLYRRAGGGGTVVLDPGMLVVSVSQKVQGIGRNSEHFRRLTNWLIAALEKLGVVGLSMRGHSDLAHGDRKLGGSSMIRSRDLLFTTTTLLVEPDLALMDRYLLHPPREPDYRRGRSHRDFLVTLGQVRPPLSVSKIQGQLKIALSSTT